MHKIRYHAWKQNHPALKLFTMQNNIPFSCCLIYYALAFSSFWRLLFSWQSMSGEITPTEMQKLLFPKCYFVWTIPALDFDAVAVISSNPCARLSGTIFVYYKQTSTWALTVKNWKFSFKTSMLHGFIMVIQIWQATKN